MRRAIWPLLVIVASAGVVAALLGAGGLFSEATTPGGSGQSVRGWLVPSTPMPAPTSTNVPAAARGDGPAAGGDQATPNLNAVRDVTPATVTPPPPVSGPLTRVAPPQKPPAPPEPWRAVVFHRPTITADLSLAARPPGPGGGRAAPIEIRLAGIAPLDEGNTCKDALGDEGPCRTVAAAALRALIGAKGIECQSPRRSIPSPLITTCRLGARDLGAWLIERGYARATTSDAATAPLPDAN